MADLVIRNASLLDVVAGDIVEDSWIAVERGRVIATGARTGAPDSAQTYDMGGSFVLPGLIDVHAHLNWTEGPDLVSEIQRELPAYLAIKASVAAARTLAAGVTTIRDGCGNAWSDIAVARAIETGVVPGPRMSAAGYGLRMTGGQGDAPSSTMITTDNPGVADGVDAVRRQARLNFKMGAGHLKLFVSGGVAAGHTSPGAPQYSQEEIAAACEVAHTRGSTVMAHSYGAEACRRAILGGVDSIEHGSLIDDEGLALMREHGTYLDPTLTPFWRGVQRVTSGPGDPRSEKSAEMYQHAVSTVQRAVAMGVTIAMGTDTGTAYNRHGENLREISLLVQAGMSPIEALRAATVNAARLMRWDDRVGSLEPGKFADLVATAEDPLAHPELFESVDGVTFVMKGGELVRDSRT
jgi:imidazolonepropionase-like amidohydrolase